MSLEQAALKYAAHGWPVFPAVPGGKEPATTNGFKDATTAEQKIRYWWNRNPRFNVAIATGAPGPDVLDVDVKNDGVAWAAFNRLKRAGLLIGGMALVRTRSGGLHVYFKGTEQGNAANIGKVPLDFRGKGGYVLAPPSFVEPGVYELIEHGGKGGVFNVATARQLLDPPTTSTVRMPRSSTNVDGLVNFVAGLQEGERNHGTYWAACRAAEKGHDMEAIVQAAVIAGLPEAEARRTVASAERTVQR